MLQLVAAYDLYTLAYDLCTFPVTQLYSQSTFNVMPFALFQLFHEVMKEKSNARLVPGVPTIHDASPTLWHSLDLWRILTHTNQVPEMALKELVQCSLDFVTEPM